MEHQAVSRKVLSNKEIINVIELTIKQWRIWQPKLSFVDTKNITDQPLVLTIILYSEI